MSGPWERYQSAQPASDGPWSRYGGSSMPSRPRTTALEGFATGFADASTFGLGDEALGVARATLSRKRGETWEEARQRYTEESREQMRRAQEEQGLAVMGGNVAAFIVPGAPATSAVRLAGKGANALLRGVSPGAARAASRANSFLQQSLAGRAVLGGGAGAVAGGVYGANSAEEGNRLAGAGTGALMGAGAGLIGAPIGEGLNAVARPVMRAFQGGQRNALLQTSAPPVAAPPRTAVDAGNARRGSQPINIATKTGETPPIRGGGSAGGGGGASTEPDDVDPRVADHLLRLLERGQISINEFERRLAAAAADGGRKIVANVAGVGARDTLRTVARMPGQTAETAEKVFDDIGGMQFDDIMRSFRDTSGATRTRFGMSKDIEEAMRRVGDEGYKPTLAQDVADGAWQAFQSVRNRMPQSVTKMADDIVNEITEGRGIASLTRGQQMHIQKQSLDAAMDTLEREGLDGLRLKSRRDLKRDLLRVIEGDEAAGIPPALPGYRQAREEYGDLYAAKRALKAARSFTTADPEELIDDVANMTPFEREAFKASVLTEVRKSLASRDRGTQTNVALALADRNRRDLLRAVFDTDEEFDAFIRVLDDRADMMRQNNRMRPGTGSDTFGNAATAGDLPTSKSDLAARAFRASVGRAFGTDEARLAQEPFRDALGSALLGRTKSPESNRALLRALREAERRRRENTRSAVGGAISGAVGGGNVEF